MAFSSATIFNTWLVIMMLRRKAKHLIGDLLKCVISVGLGMKYTDSKGRRQPQSPIISDNGGVWKYLQIIGGFGHSTDTPQANRQGGVRKKASSASSASCYKNLKVFMV